MKLHRLELEGFGPFLQRQVIDFDAFDDDGIFLIAGRTGAGKSSILDGVGFALYGGVPRYDGGAKRLRSDHCRPEDRSEVRLEFTVGDRRWRVTRSPEYERPKRNGTGLTTEEHRAVVEELVDGEWVGRAAKPREAGELLGEILGLNREQFQQVILLAQNRFAQFLLASGGDRQALLRTLFGSRTYQEYERLLDERRKDAEDALADRRRVIELALDDAENTVAAHELAGEGAPGNALPDRLGALDRAIERGRYRVEVLTEAQTAAIAARDEAFAAHEKVKSLHEWARARDAAREALAKRQARTTEIDADRRALHDARGAEGLRAPLEHAAHAEAAAQQARRAETAARAAWDEAGGQQDADAQTLAALIDDLTGRLALWQSAAAQEAELPSLREKHAAAEQRVAAAQTRIAELERQRAALPARRAELDEALRTHVAVAATADDARRVVEQARARRDAAEEARTRAETLHEADKTKLARQEEATAAAAAADALLRRRIEQRAGELASALEAGRPCPVCGSVEHPHPAPRADEPVGDDELEAADNARDAAQQRAHEAGETAATALAAYADAAARSGGLDPDGARRAFDQAVDRLTAAETAARERDRLRAERDGLDEEDARIAADIDRSRAGVTEAQDELTTLGERLTSAQAVVAAARDDFASVAARIDDGARRRAAAVALRAAIETSRTATESARAAGDDRDRRVAASDFVDAAAARAALRDDAERSRLDEKVRAHDTALAELKGQLVQLELQLAGADDPLPDLEASAAALADAREAAAAAAGAATAVVQAVESLERASERAHDAHAQIGELDAHRRLVAGIADAVAGRNERKMDLETFVLAAELEQIVAAANVRLDAMSAGRYRLAHTDALAARNAASGLGLEVVDAYTGRARPAQSLSGGETFLASLALALGLAQVVTDRAGGIRLDTLFIDEGFGSLDPETLELAMRTLDELREGGRTVGVISHVEAMKEQIPAQLVVEATAHGPSAVRQSALDPV
ncbi:SMC family ATPase [Microbacterium protaetiae]|uniref:Nuclease SbcCD subunit C n=1 Tax=Microbacterium protaetiae TaxID=2509458 RepID=A0A4P6EF11_9MICO|nr:SMC family ATPase [Microbacterium protaetiae]QAY60376.1 SMC family ATPase [Microbacterium protaetiae]